jgi:hypothetical protein
MNDSNSVESWSKLNAATVREYVRGLVETLRSGSEEVGLPVAFERHIHQFAVPILDRSDFAAFSKDVILPYYDEEKLPRGGA